MKYQSQLGNIEKRRKNKVAKLASEEASLVNWQQRLADVQERVSFFRRTLLCRTTVLSVCNTFLYQTATDRLVVSSRQC